MNFYPLKTSRRIICILWLVLIFHTIALSQSSKADLVIINAKIHTIDEKKPRAEALAVIRNKISAVGTSEEIKKLIGPGTKTIDAGRRVVIPGFNDAHVHFLSMGNQFTSIDLREAKTPGEIVEKIKFYLNFVPKGRWILGGGWNHENWSPAVLPTKELIDAVTPDNPVFIYHADAKMALANTPALRIAGIDKNFREIKASEMMRDFSGEPNGILIDQAMRRVRSFAPTSNTSDRLAIAETAANYAAFYGVTSVQDMSADDNSDVFRELEKQGKLKTRVYECTNLLGWQKTAKIARNLAAAANMIRGGCLKSFTEGETEDFSRLYPEILAADRAGRQVMLHAIGNRANETALRIFERVAKTNGRRDRRFRIEHARNFRAADAARFGRSKIIASLQPALFADPAGQGTEFLQSLLKSNAPIALGSDSAMIPVNPFDGIYAAIANSSSNQSISVDEAVRFYTLSSAYAEFQENVKGSITVGKLADLVILSEDIFTIEPLAIRNVKILTTIVNGRVVYEAR